MDRVLAPGALRMILAMAVVVEHVSRLQLGGPAVMVFFMLSGYWVMRMYADYYRFARRPLLTFYLSRFLRIWMPYAIVLLLALAVYALVPGIGHGFPDWTALTILGMASTGRDVIGITWSLDLELQFYLLLPLLWLAMSSLSSAPARWCFAALLILGSAAGWLLSWSMGIELVLAYLPLFVAGAAIHLHGLRAGGRAAALSVAAFALVGLAFCAITPLRPYLLYGMDNPVQNDLFAFLWPCLLLPFVAYNVRCPSDALDRHLGNLSYSLYLLHYPVIVILRDIVGRDFTDLEKLLLLCLMPVVAFVFYLAIDRRCERLRRDVIARLAPPVGMIKAAA